MRHRKSIMISSILKSVLIIIVLTATAESRSCPILLPNSYGQGKRSTAQILPNSSSIPNVETRIVRGSNLSPSLLPYLVALFHDDGFAKEQLCTATIVASRTLTSAAHCFTYYTYNYSFALRDTEEISAYFGARNTSTVGATKRAIKSIVIHPKYDENNRATAQYDIAYLTLRDDIPAWNKIMKVNSNSSIPMRRSIVRNMGYGVQNYHRFNNGYEYDDTKNVVQQVDIPVLGHSYCQKAWLRAARNSTTLYYNLKPAYQLCAGYLYGGCSPW